MLHSINIYIHIISGVIALGVGVIPFITEKGGANHRKAGRMFLMVTAITVLTAMNGALFFRNRPFLMMLTFFTMYQAFSGYRAIVYRENGPGKIDLGLLIIIASVVTVFTLYLESLNVVWDRVLVYYLIGYLSVFLIYDFLRVIKIIPNPKLWVFEHVIKMTGAFSALFQAAFGTIFTFWEPYTQLISASFGSVLLLVVLYFYIRKWRRAF